MDDAAYNRPLRVGGFLATKRGDDSRGPLVRMHPDDARDRLLTDGELAWVYGPRRHELATVRFDATKLPPLKDGRARSFVLRTRGYCKDTSPTTVTGGDVGPLPFRAMLNYPHFGPASPPRTDAAEWHTRPAGR